MRRRLVPSEEGGFVAGVFLAAFEPFGSESKCCFSLLRLFGRGGSRCCLGDSVVTSD